MSWSRILTSYLVIVQIALAPLWSHAVTVPELEVKDGKLTDAGKDKAAALAEYGNKMNYDSKLDLAKNKMYFIDRTTKKVVAEADLRDEKSLKEYSPKTLNQRLRANFKATGIPQASSDAAKHAVQSFPVESAAFFLALGGMAAVQLLNDYANNPNAMKDHIDHSLSPVGQIGFFMFMYSQGITTNVLNMWLKRPSLGMPIGMLGMTVGMAVQSYFSQVMQDPHIQKCFKSIYKKSDDLNPCEGAYKYLVIDKKILEGPGIASMLGTFLGVTAARLAAGAVLRLVGIELTTLLIPGGVEIKGLRWILTLAASGSNAAIFTTIQMKLEHYISYWWKNHFDGKEFVEINDDIVEQIEAQKKSQWTGKAGELNNNLKSFAKKMSEWRVNNLSEAYQAQQSWAGFLGEMTSMYAASYEFYSNYIPVLTSSGLAARDSNSKMDRLYPLFGVKPKGLTDKYVTVYFTRPEIIEAAQKLTVVDVATYMANNIESGNYKKLRFDKTQLDILSKIHQGLEADDVITNGKAILMLNDARRNYAKTTGAYNFNRELYTIAAALGDPNPMFEIGRGYAATMMMALGETGTYKGIYLDDHLARFKTPTPADYFIVQMMCGPDTSKNEEIISITKGFPAKFNAPSPALTYPFKDQICQTALVSETLGAERIYALPYGKIRTAPELLRSNLNPEARNFQTWWTSRTEKPLRDAFAEFGRQYKAVIDKLYTGLNRTGYDKFNAGFISNGAMVASFQEARLYSLILGELLKDAYKAQHKQDLPAEYFNAENDPKIGVINSDYQKSKKPLLSLLGQGAKFDFNTLLSSQPNTPTRSLKLQKAIELNLANMNALVQKARTETVKTDEYKARAEVLESVLSQFSILLGIDKKENAGPKPADVFKMPPPDDAAKLATPSQALVTLGEDQKALAVTCLELLQGVAQEMMMYGNMAGTARYPDAKKAN